jgi:hypothetical protein
MVPDVLYFVPTSSHRELSHSWLGVLTLDLALGLVLVGLWHAVAAPVLRDLVPTRIRARSPVPVALSAREWLWAVPCMVLGSVTHVAWDAFTHSDGWGVRHVPVLADTVIRGLPAFKLAQYGSGVLGVVVVLGYAVRALAESPPERSAQPLATTRERRVAWLVLGAVPVTTGLAFLVPAALTGMPTEELLYVVVVRGVSGLGLAATGVALWWHIRIRPRRAPQVAAGPVPAGREAHPTR